MPEVVLCHAKPGNLATQRIPTSPGKVAQLLDKAASLASAPGERLVLTYQGHILSPSAALEVPKGKDEACPKHPYRREEKCNT